MFCQISIADCCLAETSKNTFASPKLCMKTASLSFVVPKNICNGEEGGTK